MKRLFYTLPIIIFCFMTCRDRTSLFDIRGEDFTAPPHIWDTWVSGVYYDVYGQLCGVRMQIDFTDRFEMDLPLYHMFYHETSLRNEIEFVIEIATLAYSVEVFGPYQVGDYYLKIYFGEIPIGACYFRVVSNDGRLEIQNVEQQTMNVPEPDHWFCKIVH